MKMMNFMNTSSKFLIVLINTDDDVFVIVTLIYI